MDSSSRRGMTTTMDVVLLLRVSSRRIKEIKKRPFSSWQAFSVTEERCVRWKRLSSLACVKKLHFCARVLEEIHSRE